MACWENSAAIAVDTSSAAALATLMVGLAAAAFPRVSSAPMRSMSAAADAMASGETSTNVIAHLAVPHESIAQQVLGDGFHDGIAKVWHLSRLSRKRAASQGAVGAAVATARVAGTGPAGWWFQNRSTTSHPGLSG
ncbi:hypothetical protein [Mycobacterium marinum]|uniref:hypothetical protein n=1 Tax=Mycobacterium marinum TaxID=1781 RepID=UPI00307652FD